MVAKEGLGAWIQEGDSNATFIPATRASKYMRNQLVALNEDGNWLMGATEIKEAVKRHFESL
ncbi:hypothetical protein A2U01_0076297, partial [Trifolium medium]|nr:hypothetical protein [Trifolium medium]